MAKSVKRTTRKAARKPVRPKAKKPVRAKVKKDVGFKSFALHVTDDAGGVAFEALKAERPQFSAFALDSAQPPRLDPETAAKRILEHTLASSTVPSFTAPEVAGAESEFKSLGVETVPLTGTTVVKFRQQVKGIPVYGSLVSVELGDDNECVSINSNLATPDVKSPVAKISPQEALKKAGTQAGYGRALPDATPTLNYYLDSKGKWHLAYIIANVRIRKPSEKGPVADDDHAPLVFDYVVDALTGSLIAELPRTPSAAGTGQGVDELGKSQTFRVDRNGTRKVLRDATLNLETYDFRWRDPVVQDSALPGAICSSPPNWTAAAVSAHANATIVASFLRDVLMRNGIDGGGGLLVSSVNCVWKAYERPPGSRAWLNAFWDPSRQQMVYGQATFNGKLRSLASALDVVAHELFHGVTEHTARLEYHVESGALNESYSDIFGIIISNFAEPNIANWNWLMGDGISSGLAAFRDFEDPTRFDQPKHMDDFAHRPDNRDNDYGGVHKNSGIHNFATYSVITARDAGAFLFTPAELAAMFYVALTQQLSRQSTFSDSRRGVVLATRSLFRNRPQPELARRVAAVEAGFSAAGIQ